MIRVTIEMVPYGIEERKHTLGSMILGNDGTGSKTIGNYDVRQRGVDGQTVKNARVERHKRLEVSVWKLVAKAMAELGHKA